MRWNDTQQMVRSGRAATFETAANGEPKRIPISTARANCIVAPRLTGRSDGQDLSLEAVSRRK